MKNKFFFSYYLLITVLLVSCNKNDDSTLIPDEIKKSVSIEDIIPSTIFAIQVKLV